MRRRAREKKRRAIRGGNGRMESTRAFIHGLESSSRGAKGEYFRNRYPDMILGDFEGSFSLRMEKLEALLEGKQNLILVGSSYGGLMAAAYAFLHKEKVKRLVLLAPALHLAPYEPYRNKELNIPVIIFHGRQDAVVPLEAVRAVAQRLFPNHAFNAVDDDHSLHATFSSLDWDALLSLQD
jgi:pimeloyl-ACP methyl ester carboxylesterase